MAAAMVSADEGPSETNLLETKLRNEVSRYEHEASEAHLRSGAIRSRWLKNFDGVNPSSGPHAYGSLGQHEGLESYKKRFSALFPSEDLDKLMEPNLAEVVRGQVHGRLDVQYDKLAREEARFELAANEYRQYGVADRFAFDNLKTEGSYHPTFGNTFDDIQHSIHGTLARRMANLSSASHLARVGRSPSAVKGTSLQGYSVRGAPGRQLQDLRNEAHIQATAAMRGPNEAAQVRAALDTNSGVPAVDSQSKLAAFSSAMRGLSVHGAAPPMVLPPPPPVPVYGYPPHPPAEAFYSQPCYAQQPYGYPGLLDDGSMRPLNDVDEHFYKFSPRDTARLVDEIHRLKAEAAAPRSDLEVRYHPYAGGTIGQHGGAHVGTAPTDTTAEEAPRWEHPTNLPRRVDICAAAPASPRPESRPVFSVAPDTVMWKMPEQGSFGDATKTPLLDSLSAEQASPSIKHEIVSHIHSEPRRAVELVSKLPLAPEKKMEVLRDDVLRHLPMSATQKVELLRSVPLAPSATRVSNWKNQIMDQLPPTK